MRTDARAPSGGPTSSSVLPAVRRASSVQQDVPSHAGIVADPPAGRR
jgi:hypothetical protein